MLNKLDIQLTTSASNSNLIPVLLFEDEDILVIDKPAGILVHEDGYSPQQGTVVRWFLDRVPQAYGVGEETTSLAGKVLERSGVVHRLDRDTSGVLVLAKNNKAHIHLKSQFHDRLVRKEYRALTYGIMKEKWGTINRAIGRSPRDFRLRSASLGAKGKLRTAMTHYECLASGKYQAENFSYLKLIPKTGRTHQLRVHLKAIGHPIVGDKLYASKKQIETNNLELSRLALHAYSLEIELLSGERRTFVAQLPVELQVAIELLR